MSDEFDNEPTVVGSNEPDDRTPTEQTAPVRVGRYQILELLGRGGFGSVYKARDDQLDREVAVKVPHTDLFASPRDADKHIAEARTVASLDHPAIVPVYDVGSTDSIPCFIVSKFIRGRNLHSELRSRRLSTVEAIDVVLTLAEALQHAHGKGFVHRDVKPGNILIDEAGQAHLVDFGLAIRDDEPLSIGHLEGTASYMSPEQARGEGHRIDGRSDVFSLGIVMYEMLAGRHPFRSNSHADVIRKLEFSELRPLRQYNESLPRELERICTRATAKRASERYQSAYDMAADLRTVRDEVSESNAGQISAADKTGVITKTVSYEIDTTESEPSTQSGMTNVVPRGLRSFDRHDSEFFLQLLPGARDLNGLPDVISFWKARIEETDVADTFPLGLIYGPSGCGKTSMVKAGLLPRLDSHVKVVYAEATPGDTETRLLNGLRQRLLTPQDRDLTQTLAGIRRGEGVADGEKLLIVIDQFEQWLHATEDLTEAPLVNALRQCDGRRVQCVIMLRDDFWMAITRFLAELEVELLQGQNFAAVDLFPVRHAERVLEAFGRAYGELPAAREMNDDQKQFVRQAVEGLASDGSVVCVRLTLFAEMMKNKPWTVSSLKQLGGPGGVGVKFLDETFSAPSANPRHRIHQKAARAVLKSLLPDTGAEIKGHMRSYAELLEASGYSNRPGDFEELIHILDREVRLITPTDPAGLAEEDESFSGRDPRDKYFHMTHDYLVHSLREWLTRKQKETRKGRAELALYDRAVSWKAKQENRLLPSMWEYLFIRWNTDRDKWSDTQKEVMNRARHVHGRRLLLVAVLFVGACFAGQQLGQRIQRDRDIVAADGAVKGLLGADVNSLNSFLPLVRQYEIYTTDMLDQAIESNDLGSTQRLNAAIGRMPSDDASAILNEEFLTAAFDYFPVILNALVVSDCLDRDALQSIALDETADNRLRFRAACALASVDDSPALWQKLSRFTARELVNSLPSELGTWAAAVAPVSDLLDSDLLNLVSDESVRELNRYQAADVLARYYANDPDALFNLTRKIDGFQFAPVFDRLRLHPEELNRLAAKWLIEPIDDDAAEDYEQWAAGRANVIIAMLRLGHPEHLWNLLESGGDVQVQSYLLARLSICGVDPTILGEELLATRDHNATLFLLEALGEFELTRLPGKLSDSIVSILTRRYESESDAGIQSACDWLLREWACPLPDVFDSEVTEEAQLADALKQDRQWFFNSQGQKMILLNIGEFEMGSPGDEPERHSNESLHTRAVNRRIAVSATEVTTAQYDRFLNDVKKYRDIYRPENESYIVSPDCPQTGMTWYEMAAYCNWLTDKALIPPGERCYVSSDDNRDVESLQPADDYLSKKGYRMPTEAEWEYSCRGGTKFSRYYGSDPELLRRYAWFLYNADGVTRPVGSLRPNRYGLFDTLGNAAEQCFERYGSYRTSELPVLDLEDQVPVDRTDSRPIRGGSVGYVPKYVRSAARGTTQPHFQDYTLGLRPVRTIP